MAAFEQTTESFDDEVPAKTAELMTQVKYESIASVLRQYARSKSNYSGHNEESLSVNNTAMANNGSSYKSNGRFLRNNRSPEEVANMKKGFPWHQCCKFGYWANEHK